MNNHQKQEVTISKKHKAILRGLYTDQETKWFHSHGINNPAMLYKKLLKHSVSQDHIIPFLIKLGLMRLALNSNDVLDTIYMAEELGESVNLNWSYSRFESEHDRMSKIIQRNKLKSKNKLFKIPEWAENLFEGFHLIRSSARLAIEGQRQGHCIASNTYLNRAASGEIAIYSFMFLGQRWTMKVSNNDGRMDTEIHGKNNAPPPTQINQYVRARYRAGEHHFKPNRYIYRLRSRVENSVVTSPWLPNEYVNALDRHGRVTFRPIPGRWVTQPRSGFCRYRYPDGGYVDVAEEATRQYGGAMAEFEDMLLRERDRLRGVREAELVALQRAGERARRLEIEGNFTPQNLDVCIRGDIPTNREVPESPDLSWDPTRPDSVGGTEHSRGAVHIFGLLVLAPISLLILLAALSI